MESPGPSTLKHGSQENLSCIPLVLSLPPPHPAPAFPGTLINWNVPRIQSSSRMKVMMGTLQTPRIETKVPKSGCANRLWELQGVLFLCSLGTESLDRDTSFQRNWAQGWEIKKGGALDIFWPIRVTLSCAKGCLGSILEQQLSCLSFNIYILFIHSLCISREFFFLKTKPNQN